MSDEIPVDQLGTVARLTARAEKAEAEVARLRAALVRIYNDGIDLPGVDAHYIAAEALGIAS